MGCNHKIDAFSCFSIIVEPDDSPYFIYQNGWKVKLRHFCAVKIRIASPLGLGIALRVTIYE